MPGTPGLRLCLGTTLPAWALPPPEELREYPLEMEPSHDPLGPLLQLPRPPVPAACTSPPSPTGTVTARVPAFTLDPASYLAPSTNNNYPHVPPSQRT